MQSQRSRPLTVRVNLVLFRLAIALVCRFLRDKRNLNFSFTISSNFKLHAWRFHFERIRNVGVHRRLRTTGTDTRVTADGRCCVQRFRNRGALPFLFNRQTFPKPNRIFGRESGVTAVIVHGSIWVISSGNIIITAAATARWNGRRPTDNDWTSSGACWGAGLGIPRCVRRFLLQGLQRTSAQAAHSFPAARVLECAPRACWKWNFEISVLRWSAVSARKLFDLNPCSS